MALMEARFLAGGVSGLNDKSTPKSSSLSTNSRFPAVTTDIPIVMNFIG